MALLAEGKKKAKYGLDPQNTQWSNDSNKFGQRLMEKMGWEKGKGLGANENGMTEHIKASYKWDQCGLGASPQSADAWVAHQDDFNDLLKMLNSGKQDEEPEEKDRATLAKDGHKRYYGRFARGRVQKLRTTEDLDCIFGRRKSASAPTTPANQSAANSGDEASHEEEEGNGVEKSHGLTTVTSTTSVQDYFAQKMKEMKARRTKAAPEEESKVSPEKEGKPASKTSAAYGMVGFSYGDDTKEEEGAKDNSDKTTTESEERPSRGWYNSWNLDQREGHSGDAEGDSSGSKKKKKKKDKKTKRDVLADERGSTEAGDGEFVGESEEVGGDEKEFSSHKHLEEKESSKKKKKRKRDQEEELNLDANKKTKISIDSQASECGSVQELGGVSSAAAANDEETGKVSKKKKKKRKASKEPEDDGEQHMKKVKTCESIEIGDESLNLKSETKLVDGESEESKPKKKKRKEKKLDKAANYSESLNNHSKDGGGSDLNSKQQCDESGGKKKKKKRVKGEGVKGEEVSLTNDAISSRDNEDNDEGSKVQEKIGLSDGQTELEEGGKKKKKRRKRKKKPAEPKPKKSIFPGSNFEDIVGYGEVKPPQPEEIKEPEPEVKEPEPEIIDTRKLMTRDIDKNLREIAKALGGCGSKKSEDVDST